MIFIIIFHLKFPLINGDKLLQISQMLKTWAKVVSSFVRIRIQEGQMQNCMLFKYLSVKFHTMLAKTTLCRVLPNLPNL